MLNKLRDEVGQFTEGIVKLFLDAGEILGFGVGVVVAVVRAVLAPLAGVEGVE